MPILISNSEEDTKKIAKSLAKNITSGVVALTGELGAGKTTFVQAFAKSLGIKEKIISPTFILIKQFQIPKNKKAFYHIDLYRLENNSQIKDLGLEEIINNASNLVLIEWAEKLKNLPKEAIKITIKRIKDNKREFTILP